MSDKPVLNEKFVTNLQGKEFVEYPGLIDLAHQIGISSIETEILQYPSGENDFVAITKSTVVTKDGRSFSDIGDASPASVNSMVTPHLIRMSSTRSKARALRDLTNVGMTAVEELNVDGGGVTPDIKSSTKNGMSVLVEEAKILQDKIIANGRVEELAEITGGRRLTDIKSEKSLKSAVNKAKELI